MQLFRRAESRRIRAVSDVRRERTYPPRQAGSVPRHGSTPFSLLYQLEPQHVPHRAPVRGTVLGGDVQTGAAGWLPLH